MATRIPSYSGGGVGCAALQSSSESDDHEGELPRGRREARLRKCPEEPQNCELVPVQQILFSS